MFDGTRACAVSVSRNGQPFAALLLLLAFDVPPVTAPSIAACVGLWLAPFGARRGRMPKRPASGQGWPVAGPRRRREAQGTPHRASAFAMRGAVVGWRRFLVTFWRCCQKVTRL